MKCVEKDVWLPDREEYLVKDIKESIRFAGQGTVQFRKFQRAFGVFRNFRTAVDVGANIGLWTRVMACCFEKVESFEPNPEVHDAFVANNTRGNITLHRVAIGKEPGSLRFNTGKSSTGFTHVDENGELKAEVRTLDSYSLTDVDFIKIDVEGWEYPVVAGAESTIRYNRPVIIVEQKPKNAERVGYRQFQASKLLQQWGAEIAATLSGDMIMHWPVRK
jgi:FkbM family methyltransferase